MSEQQQGGSEAKQVLDEVTGEYVSKNELKKRQKMRQRDAAKVSCTLQSDS